MAQLANQRIVVDLWDVGQGDATVIRMSPMRAFMIDVGPRNSPIVDWISQDQRVFIEGIVLTHNDADHAGAIASLVDAAPGRIGTVYFLADRDIKGRQFRLLFERLDAAHRAGSVKQIIRLEAPQVLWKDSSNRAQITVRYPGYMKNLAATTPNATSAVLTLTTNDKIRIVWASDSSLEVVAGLCGGQSPEYLVGPHHGAPIDRAKVEAQAWISAINAETTFISVGSRNGHAHPQPSYLKKIRACGSRIQCTQLTKLCDRFRITDVVKSHAILGLRRPNTGIGCRGPVRLTLVGGNLVPDALDAEHQREIRGLERPRCLRN